MFGIETGRFMVVALAGLVIITACIAAYLATQLL